MYGTDNLSVKNNVIYHGVNELVEMEGVNHTLVNNLMVLSLAEGTYKVSINSIYSVSYTHLTLPTILLV